MRRFTQLYLELDSTTRTSEKVAAMVAYFRDSPPEDAAWALCFLSERRVNRLVSTRLLRDWIAQESGYPPWMIDECYDVVGDLAETLALLLPEVSRGTEVRLSAVVEQRVLPLRELDDAGRRDLVVQTWREMDTNQRFVWHKLITGGFRVGVARKLVVNALAVVAGVEPAIMAHRLAGHFDPTPAAFAGLISGDVIDGRVAQPYPFFLASPLEMPPEELGAIEQWQAEWKWDGIRAQLIRRGGEIILWSRGEELITPRYPEIIAASQRLPDGTVMDGEILAWSGEAPLPFAQLQRRIGRIRREPRLWEDVPVIFMAYDLLEDAGADVRAWPMLQRRARLEAIVNEADQDVLRLSPIVRVTSWGELRDQHDRAGSRGVEGIMLKRLDSPYRVGRTRGDWWKWKVNPYTVDAVLIYAQLGNGKRASLFTDYTFGVWDQGELVPVAKAYSGLTEDEIRQVDRFVRRSTLERHGPVRVVRPELVFELAFEALQVSNRHKAGLALRFPRMNRWRHDKQPQDADTLDALRAMLHRHESRVQ